MTELKFRLRGGKVNTKTDFLNLLKNMIESINAVLADTLPRAAVEAVIRGQNLCSTAAEWQGYFSKYRAGQEAAGNGDKTVSELDLAITYAMLAGGKRLRPILAVLVYEMLSRQALPAKSETWPDVLKYLIRAVESIHIYSLIHDDLPAMDNDSLRHGRPTLHTFFSEGQAILVGDALLSEAWQYATKTDNVEAGMILAQNALAMVHGQWRDLAFTDQKVTYQDLCEMVKRKTAALIAAPVLAAATLTEADALTKRQLSQFAENLGIAFQIRDDILDVEAESERMGKTLGKDAAEHKTTFVKVLGMVEAKRELVRYTDIAKRALADLADRGYETKNLAELTAWLVDREV